MTEHNESTEGRDRTTNDANARDSGRWTGTSRRQVLRVVGGTGVGLGIGVGAFTGVAAAHEVTKVVFCECAEVTVYGELLLGSDTDADATGDGGYRAVLYCDGTLVRRPLEGTQTRQHYSLLEDAQYEYDDCQILAVEGETWHPDHRGTTFRFCNDHCEWDCAEDGLAEQEAGWCDDPADVPSGGGSGGVDPDTEIVIECVTDCVEEPEGCTPGYWKEPAYRNGVWTDQDEYGPSTLVVETFDLAVTGASGSGGGGGRGRPVAPRGRGGGRGGPIVPRGRGGGRVRGGNDRDWAELTLLEALDGGGGPSIEGAQTILIRAAVAALVNAQHPKINYPMTTAEIINDVDAALATNDRGTIIALADQLDEYNNLGCPLDAFGRTE